MATHDPFVLTVPLDHRELSGLTADDKVKVVARTADGSTSSIVVALGDRDRSDAELTFPSDPGRLKLAIGPAEADDHQILDAETLGVSVPSRMWDDLQKVTLAPIKIGPFHWGWWRRWCRTITIKGRLVCPDGRGVPGARVCVDDIDRWFIWTSRDEIACTTTEPDGSFSMTFRWCCGSYPWWWWFRVRPWVLDDTLAAQVGTVMDQFPEIRLEPPTALPSLSTFAGLLQRQDRELAAIARQPLSELDPATVDKVRDQLVKLLPAAPELERLAIWPWLPWSPWRDCRPDLVFRAVQDCGLGPVSVLHEGVNQTRWDVPDQLEVTLVATSDACCLPVPPEQDCLILDSVCNQPMHRVAGNDGAPAAPSDVEGYLITYTDGVDQALDIPFGGNVPIRQNPSDLIGVDYYAFEHSTDGGASWLPLPAGASAAFSRYWQLFPGPIVGGELFAPITVGAYQVFETRRHFEDTHYGDWSPGGGRYWLSVNHDLLLSLDSTKLPDGRQLLRVVQFVKTGPEDFKGPEPVRGCDRETQASCVLVIDNRAITALGHDPSHNCGGVHLCTVEPDTHIRAVLVDGKEVAPCDTIGPERGSVTEIEFEVTDPDGHLGWFTLTSHYGNSGVVDLLAAGSLTCISGGPDASDYAGALAGGAPRPVWRGGVFRLRIPTGRAFPVPCCYLLRLEAGKRTLENCTQWVRNVSEMTLGIGV
ncbi:MAG: hypothetical protein QM582_06635 [Micropruina sp.]|uniref:hypothetical protein n=1 Tax=Micropruina sp. TaxID=2737536 RepID=UPI0039E6EA41